jgi:NitT/TauT family transport system substrate-binding protein/putative hydroxymethylpyrimidine transport system substrate-binding protein
MLAFAALAGGCGGEDGEPGEPRRAVLALDFAPNAVHAGIYAAVAGEHDRAAGVRLEIRAPAASTDSLRLLASRRADLAIVDIHDLGLAREREEDVVAVGALVQRPLAAVIARSGIERPRDLEGRRAGVTGLPSDDAVLRAVVEGDGGDFERVDRVTIGFTAVPSLISEKVDAATAFWNAEGVALREEGVETREFRVDRFGAPSYPELVVVVRRETLERDRELVEGVLDALAQGTREVLRDPGEALRRVAEASKAEGSLVRAQFDAVRPALEPPVALDREALEGWARFDERFGILERRPDLDEAFDFSLAPR